MARACRSSNVPPRSWRIASPYYASGSPDRRGFWNNDVSDVLVEQDRVAVRVDDHEVGGAGGRLVRRGHRLDAVLAQATLQFAHIRVGRRGVAVGVPTWIEREHVAVEHALEEPDRGEAVAQDLVVLPVPADRLEAEGR